MEPKRDPLSETLAGWQIQPAADPNFRPAVMARLGQIRPPRDWPSYVRTHTALWATAAIMILAAAAWTGHAAGQARNQADRSELADTYVRRLDPRAMATMQP